jgi:hypothetical protein
MKHQSTNIKRIYAIKLAFCAIKNRKHIKIALICIFALLFFLYLNYSLDELDSILSALFKSLINQL